MEVEVLVMILCGYKVLCMNTLRQFLKITKIFKV